MTYDKTNSGTRPDYIEPVAASGALPCQCEVFEVCAVCDPQTHARLSAKPAPVPRLEAGERLDGQVIRDLVTALKHMKICVGCGEDAWESCEGGVFALSAIKRAEAALRAEVKS